MFPCFRLKRQRINLFFIFLLWLAVPLFAEPPADQKPESADNDTCFTCHDDPSGSSFVDPQKFKLSIHGKNLCTSCHKDLVGVDFPHDTPVARVDCGSCHEKEKAEFSDSLHGKALERGDSLAPRCGNCHGYHDILSISDPNSKLLPLRIPFVCGSCHSEGQPVQVQREIHEDHIIENYSESIHGEGLLKKGLSVSATCVSCHKAHQILPHTDPRSSIARENISKTCLQCHSQIEEVHRKVIKGELWEQKPHLIPVCVDCHQPHKVRKVFYNQGMADADCLMCHGKPEIVSTDGRPLFVDEKELKNSIHAAVSCAKCHAEVSVAKLRPCETVTKKVDCSICHNEQVQLYDQGIHGKLFAEKNPNAPGCTDCHGTHSTLSKKNPSSSTYPTNVPALCARCHREHEKAAVLYKGPQHEITEHYVESIHGKGLLKSGLVVTAMCTNCHSAHKELPKDDPESSVNRNNIAVTCAKCHQGVYEKYMQSVHAPGEGRDSQKLPVCNDCHTAHTIKRTDIDVFKFETMNVCGKCHIDIAKTYFDTFHGKVTKLGFTKTAKCYDCHGSHEILPVFNPHSTLSRENIVGTCQKCHPGATKRFAGYLTHATHHDPKKYPWIFWTFWLMTALLVGVFTVSGAHAILWLPKSLEMRRAHPPYNPTEKQYVRFPLFYRILHGIMIVSFLTLAMTGMILKFSYAKWAIFISGLTGGFAVSGFLHRSAALCLIGIVSAHLFDVITSKRKTLKSWKAMIFGPDTILFTIKDWREFIATVKWYLGKGERPLYGRWTYWEKFDYFAVFWGTAIIGCSGLILWFPEACTHILPGWVINVATIIHSDEALLAAGFIFTVHFFNTHFRPEKFPMDTVIFTGRMSLEELKRERPAEHEALLLKNELDKHLVDPLPPETIRVIKIFAWMALVIGLSLVIAIIYAMVFEYK